jgi:hypothetical protein
MNIKGFKLVTGEEVISNTTIGVDGRALLINPMQLRVVPPKINGAPPSMGFVPFPAFADQSKDVAIIIEPLHIAYTYDPDQNIIDNYNAMMSGGSSNQLITG